MAVVSVIVPARGEDETLPWTLPHVLASAALLDNAEVVVVLPTGTTYHRELKLPAGVVRWVFTDEVGKFAALRTGVAVATGDRLIFIDADVMAQATAFVALDAAICAGADVAAGRIVVLSESAGGPRALRVWSAITCASWHAVRDSRPELRWALPGALYGMRREFFSPAAPLVPMLDDVSIGLSAFERGARFAYVPEAWVAVTPPAGYRQWFRQKVRTRRGWRLLRRLRPGPAAALEVALARHRTALCRGSVTGRLMPIQDRIVRMAALWPPGRAVSSGAWKPDRAGDMARLFERVHKGGIEIG